MNERGRPFWSASSSLAVSRLQIANRLVSTQAQTACHELTRHAIIYASASKASVPNTVITFALKAGINC